MRGERGEERKDTCSPLPSPPLHTFPLFSLSSKFLRGQAAKNAQTETLAGQAISWPYSLGQEPVTWSLHLSYQASESTLFRVDA